MAKNRHQRRATEKVIEQTINVPHARAPDFREFHCDGATVRMDPSYVVLTHFINDATILTERMELLSQTPGIAAYKPVGVDEKRFRTDVCAVRIPLATFQEIISLYNTQLATVGQAFAQVNAKATKDE